MTNIKTGQEQTGYRLSLVIKIFFISFADTGKFIYYPLKALPLNLGYIKSTVKYLSLTTTWGYFLTKDRNILVFVEQGNIVNSAHYLNILDQSLLVFMELYRYIIF